MDTYNIYCNGQMIDPEWHTRVIIPDNLPIQDGVIYLDFETTSRDPLKSSVNPHRDCYPLGIAVLFGNDNCPYYIPVDKFTHEEIKEWLEKLLLDPKREWVNHHIRFDAHVIINSYGFQPHCKLTDTLILAKLHEFPEQFSYSLDNVCKLLGFDITKYEAAIKVYLKHSKDYAAIPLDKIAVYAAVDVLAVRRLHQKLKVHPEVNRVLDMENSILQILLCVEQVGLRVDVSGMCEEWKRCVPIQGQRLKMIRELSGFPEFIPNKRAVLKELFVNRLGMQLDFTDTSLEKYTKGTITHDEMTLSYGYASLLKHRAEAPEIIDTYIDFCETAKLMNSFLEPYVVKYAMQGWVVRPSFNQMVRTGRLSCRDPNLQQVPSTFKQFILPYNDEYLLAIFDLSQIEYRVLTHYLGNKACSDAYKNDPNTDYHQLIADLAGINRRAAKTLNFALAFGSGKDKCLAILAEQPELIQDLDDLQIKVRSLEVYNAYHTMLPELKALRRRAMYTAQSRGYVRTLYGRRRYFLPQYSYKALNTVVQGSAADIAKNITLRLRKYMGNDCMLHCLVHDSWVFSIKKNCADELIPLIKAEIEANIHGLDVPILCSVETSALNWGDAKEN